VELPERVQPGFRDRRVGVVNHSFKKQQIFNLEEPLTHMGNELDYDNLDQLSDDNNNYDDVMDKDITRMNFGGFEPDGKEVQEKDGNVKKTRNEIMKEVILKSKTFKRERQMQKEMDLNVQEDLDKDLEEIRGMLAPMPTRIKSEGKMVVNQERLGMLNGFDGSKAQITGELAKDQQEPSDYDKVFRELAFEKRAKPTDRQKTEEEIAIDMKKELEKQEARRIRRMKGLPSDDEEDTVHRKGGKDRELLNKSKHKQREVQVYYYLILRRMIWGPVISILLKKNKKLCLLRIKTVFW
jgi:nucleolar protein 14